MAFDGSDEELIETVKDRLQDSTLLEDRRGASRTLKSMAKANRVEVSKWMDVLIAAIKSDRHETDIVNNCLDSINYIISGSLADSSAATWPDTDQIGDDDRDPGREFAEIFFKREENFITILEDTLNDNDWKTRWISIKVLCGLARHSLTILQDSILAYPPGISRLILLLVDEQELIRNDALMLFVRLTQSNICIQKLVVLEKCYEKIMIIIQREGYLEGTFAVIMDCLNILLNLTLSIESNQIEFRNGGNIERLMPFLDSITTLNWTPVNRNDIMRNSEKSACIMLVLRLIDSLIIPTNSINHIQASQDKMKECGLLDRLCSIMTVSNLPIGVLSETMNLASDILRGNLEQNAHVVMQTNSIMPILLLSMVKEMCQELYKFNTNR